MSEGENKSSKTVQVPIFNGKKNQFGIWYPRFKAYCVAKGIHEALEDNFVLPADPKAVSTTDPAKQEHKAKISKNAAASAALTLAFTTATLMDIVTSTETEEYPGGKAKEAIQKLFRKYRPQDNISKVEAKTELSRLQFSPGAHPEKFFMQLAVMKNKYPKSKKFEAEELIPVILSKAPDTYKSVLTAESRAKGNALTMEDIEETMVEQFRLSNNKVNGSGDRERDGELILNMMEDRVCQICKKPGHTAAQCKFNKNRKTKKSYRFKGNCNNCGRRGHKKADCWLLESNAHKRPHGRKRPSSN